MSRADSGRVRLTERDLRVLTWTGEMYAVDLDVLGLLLARWSPQAVSDGSRGPLARSQAGRLERAGVASRRTVLRRGSRSGGSSTTSPRSRGCAWTSRRRRQMRRGSRSGQSGAGGTAPAPACASLMARSR